MKKILSVVAMLLLTTGIAFGQATTGEIAGTVKDVSGALVTNATISVTSESQGTTSVVKTNNSGDYRLGSLLPGRYDVQVDASGFKTYTIKAVSIDVSKTSTIDAILSVSTSTAVEVTTQAAVNLDTTSNNLTTTYGSSEITELPTTATGFGALNASLLAPNVASNGGVGVGTGPSIGGNRPRDNNFMIEGVDNNEKSVTGPMVEVPSDATADFTVITNQFSPEFGHSTGGQFNTTILSGTNQFHGKAVEYFQNRNLNAASGIQGGKVPNARYDANLYGGEVNGPIIHNKLFFYGLYERGTVGQSGQYYICTPTAAGISTINGLVGPYGLNANNVAQYVKYTPVSPTQVTGTNDNACFNQAGATPQTLAIFQGTSLGPQVNGANVVNPVTPYGSSTSAGGIYGSGAETDIPLGNYLIKAPNYSNARTVVSSADYTLSTKDNFRFRYIYHANAGIDTSANLPAFYAASPLKQHFGSLSEFHTFTANLTNEVRIGYHREQTATPVGSQSFTGLNAFPNLVFEDQGAIQYGPDPNGPQSGIQNLYQFVDNVIYNHGKHLFTVGFDGRKAIAPQSFTQRVRGDYEYGYLTEYFHDLGPTSFGQRSTGNFFYYGDQTALYGYANDTWRATPKLTINYGLRYEFTSVPTGERAQALNIAASVPGLITFSAPQPQYKNFAPRFGVAYAPDEKTSIRAGFGIAYDVLFDNLGLLSFPPQYSATTNVVAPNQTPNMPITVPPTYPAEPPYYYGQANFLTNGGLPAGTGTLNTYPTLAAQRTATSAYLPNQTIPYVESWSLTVQHVIARDFTAEIQYIGTHGVHLIVQDQINKQPKVTTANQLTTYLTGTPLNNATPSLATSATVATAANANTYSAVSGLSNVVPAFLANNFTTSLTSYQPYGMSNYNGIGLNINSRMRHGLQFSSSYTYSKTMDNSTTEVNADALSQRRPQNSQNVAADYSRSALDRRNRLTIEMVYAEPFFQHSHLYLKDTLGGWLISPIYTYESPEYVTVISGTNANLNGDSSSISRTIANPGGNLATGSKVVPTYSTNPALIALCTPPATTCSADLVGYTALNPSAYYIQAGAGTLPTTARNTLPGRPIDNIDMTASKRIAITDRFGFEFQAIAYNVLNHAQYVPGSIDGVGSTNTSAAGTAYLRADNPAFNVVGKEWSNSARSMQLVGKFIF